MNKKHVHLTFESFRMYEERDEEYFDYKEQQSKGELTKVTAIELQQATARSRMYVDTLNSLDEYARLYEKCDRIIKELTNRRTQAKDNLMGSVDSIFDTIDGTITRVVDTQNVLITISKHDPERIDLVPNYEAALEYIKENYVDLSAVVDEAIEATMKEKAAPAARVSNVSVKRRIGGMREYDPELEESKKISESVTDWLKSLWEKVKRVFSKVDNNLDAAKKLVYES
jgi:hypothetical protein